MSHLTGKKAQAMLLDATCPAPTRALPYGHGV